MPDIKATIQTFTKPGSNGMTWLRLQQTLAQMHAAYVKAGVLGTGGARKAGAMTNSQLASIHEYGLGTAPARPFIGPPFRKNRPRYIGQLRAAYDRAVKTGNPELVKRALGLIGQQMAADMKGYVTQGAGVPPPNAPSTIAQKGSSRPLVDTGAMVNAITYQVVGTDPPAAGHHEESAAGAHAKGSRKRLTLKKVQKAAGQYGRKAAKLSKRGFKQAQRYTKKTIRASNRYAKQASKSAGKSFRAAKRSFKRRFK